MNLVAGKYLGKVIDYCVKTTESGKPQVAVKFEFGEGNHLVWNGNLWTEQGRTITAKALKAMGLCSVSIKDLARGPESGVLDMDKQVELDIDFREYEGKRYAQINWVNEVGGGGFKNRLSEVEAVQACAGLDFEAALLQAGVKTGKAYTAKPTETTKQFSIHDIPF
jgi:hypothetical protein